MIPFYQQRTTELRKIYNHFTPSQQADKLVEESKELCEILKQWIASDCSPIYWDHVIEELADVSIMLMQLKDAVAQKDPGDLFDEQLSDQIEFKIARTLKRIETGYYNPEGV